MQAGRGGEGGPKAKGKKGMKKTKKVLMLGLDGLSFDLVMDLIGRGKLKTLEKFTREGAYCRLHTTFGKSYFKFLPMRTIQSATAWTSIMTGKVVKKHRIYGFRDRSGTWVNSSMVKDKRIWDILSELGYRVCVINIPVTYPPQPVNGVMVSGIPVPKEAKDLVYPESLRRQMDGYRVEIPFKEYEKEYPNLDYEKLKRDAYDVIDKRFKFAMKMLKEDWDLFIVNFLSIDDIQHFCWHSRTRIIHSTTDRWSKGSAT